MATDKEMKVLMLPWLGYGHISPFLELAKKLSKRNLYIYFCSTPVNLTSIKTRLTSTDFSSIQLVELHLPSSPDLPPKYHTNNGLPPHLQPKLFQAFNDSKSNFTDILSTCKPDLVIYDSHQTWVPDVALSHQIPAVYFHVSGATSKSFFYYTFKNRQTGLPFPSSVVHLRMAEIKKMIAAAPIDASTATEDPFLACIDKSVGFMLIKSCDDIEDKYLNYLSRLVNKKVVPVGLLTDHLNPKHDEDDNEYPGLMKWLDSKEKASSVYVSFGSETFLSKKEMEELGFGLEMSGANFIWVIRFPAGENIKIEEVLPEGFVERVKGRGMIVEGWAPQNKILGHSSTGGFLSHCGWSSVTESLCFGVPIIGLPMNFDQPLNGRLVVELGAGLEIEKDENLEFKREEVARVIKQVLNNGLGESAHVGKKAKELSDIIKMNEEKVLLAAMEEIRNICIKH